MDFTLGQIVALIIVGALAGSAAATVMRSKRRGRWIRNTILGIVGALVGAVLFDLLDISLPEIFTAAITLGDVIIAFIGAIIVIFIVDRLR